MSVVVLASTGPFTTIFEGAVTSMGAGIVVGGFIPGVTGFALKRPPAESESKALAGGYLGGLFGLSLAIVDLAVGYAL